MISTIPAPTKSSAGTLHMSILFVAFDLSATLLQGGRNRDVSRFFPVISRCRTVLTQTQPCSLSPFPESSVPHRTAWMSRHGIKRDVRTDSGKQTTQSSHQHVGNTTQTHREWIDTNVPGVTTKTANKRVACSQRIYFLTCRGLWKGLVRQCRCLRCGVGRLIFKVIHGILWNYVSPARRVIFEGRCVMLVKTDTARLTVAAVCSTSAVRLTHVYYYYYYSCFWKKQLFDVLASCLRWLKWGECVHVALQCANFFFNEVCLHEGHHTDHRHTKE